MIRGNLLIRKLGQYMAIHDDDDMGTIVKATVDALKEGAFHIGKADRGISSDQIAEVEAAVKSLQSILDLKK